MFFSGDPSSRKRVDLGGRSSKERDRQKLLEQTRLERNKRLWMRQQHSSALIIQKSFRGRKEINAERSEMRQRFFSTFGKQCQNVDRHSFGPDSEFLRQLLFFFNPKNIDDFSALMEACCLVNKYARDDDAGILSLFSGTNYSSNRGLVDLRVRKFVMSCVQAVHENRIRLRNQLMASEEAGTPGYILLETVHLLIDRGLPWACKTVGCILQMNVLSMFRNIILVSKEESIQGPSRGMPSLERILSDIVLHVGQGPCTCVIGDPKWSFSSQILTIPFLWQPFPRLREFFARPGLSQHYLHQIALCIKDQVNFLPKDIPSDFPCHASLLGNLLEAAGVAFAQPEAFDMAIDFSIVGTYLLVAVSPIRPANEGSGEYPFIHDDQMNIDDGPTELLNRELEQQIFKAIDSRFLLQLINVLLGGFTLSNNSYHGAVCNKGMLAVAAASAFLHVTLNILPLDRVMTLLAYRTELIPVLWTFMKYCHENDKWSMLSNLSTYLPNDAPGWLLPLAVFCPVYTHMLMIVDNEEFYEQEKPLRLDDIRCLVDILRQALWQLLWLNPVAPPMLSRSPNDISVMKTQPIEFLQHKVCVTASELMSQLQNWNNRRQFISPSGFHADGVNDYFMSQALTENTRANDILKLAPFLVPFTGRAKIFTSHLAAVRERSAPQAAITRNRFRMRRDHILEDAFGQLNDLSEEDLRGQIRITFVNEFGAEEAGIDGGGIFKDFMETVSRAAFDVQYGLFKETADHLLYPNPGSGLVHDVHLQLFYFLGTVLAKAMFEGILVDIPFATFFLSKLKQKYNYLNDLPSLDPELYRHLIFLKHFEGDISQLELFFVIINNEYGEQAEEELLPGGKNKRVTNDNVITYIHLVANHRLNFQIRQQSSYFLRGFQQLIQKEWIDMFNEHELQLLISGATDGFDLDDLRENTNYAGGYHQDHYVIEMFWEVMKGLSLENQRKFLKFVTGCSRGPLLGFKRLEPVFCIQRAGGTASEEALERLPTAATCMNLLKLPPYRRKEQMEQKLLYAINAAAGFDLS